MNELRIRSSLARRGLLAGTIGVIGAGFARVFGATRVEAGHNTNIAYDSQTTMHVDVTNTTAGSTRISSNISGTAAFVGLNNYPVGISRPDGILGRTAYTTSNCAGVAGACESASGGIGAMGTSKATNGVGVYGYAGSVVPSTVGPPGTGVYGSGPSRGVSGLGRGTATDGSAGVYGISTDGFGVWGTSTNSYGVLANSVSGIAIVASTPGGQPSIYGQAVSGAAVFGTSDNHALWGASANGYGVYGVSTTSIGVVGANSSAQPGVYGASQSGAGIFGTTTGGGSAGHFVGSVLVQGGFTVEGGPKSAAVPGKDGKHRRVYCQESPEPWFEDFGRAQLVNGRAQVQLDPEFAGIVTSDGFHVFITSEVDSKGLYVVAQKSDTFEVREAQGGTTNGVFSYRIVARRKDIQNKRLEEVKLSEQVKLVTATPPKSPFIPRPPKEPESTDPPARSEEIR